MNISTELLRSHKACINQIELFRFIFPDADTGVELTRENWELAKSRGLQTDWLARLLPEQKQQQYQAFISAAISEYIKDADAAWDEYIAALGQNPYDD
ncbi:MAG: hypothetical protein K2Z81_17285 [Cyanobacteria bacterium]|nr:hypothetical protein [Cyanobacteriota bacterium]